MTVFEGADHVVAEEGVRGAEDQGLAAAFVHVLDEDETERVGGASREETIWTRTLCSGGLRGANAHAKGLSYISNIWPIIGVITWVSSIYGR